tara:strand:- start:1440 stop:2105 length:666 start_codon:yes stop_codon:yes gene_type:complete
MQEEHHRNVRFTQDPSLEREVLDRLRDKYLTTKPHPHLTELLYCLTRAWYDQRRPLPPSDQELMYFAIGFGLEAVILRVEGERDIESTQVDGVWLTLDYIDLYGQGADLKSTRMYPDPMTGEPKRGWPENWHKQFMAYARLLGSTNFGVVVMYLVPAKLVAGVLSYSKQDMDDNWEWVLDRAGELQMFLDAGEPPPPFTTNAAWECKNCRYRMRCEVLKGT